jgi:DNA-directed RNA polymerase specialized sigma24 family protein
MATESDVAALFERAEDIILGRYSQRFRNARISHRFDADDLVQLTFQRALRYASECNGDVLHWILKIAANCARTEIRAHRKVKRRSVCSEMSLSQERDGESVTIDLDGDEVDPLDAEIQREKSRHVHACLNRLTP